SLKIKKESGSQSSAAYTLVPLGLLAEKEGKIEEAVRLLREALDIWEKLGFQKDAELTRRRLERLEPRAP
ncbi:MAG TPA: hypothetical protein VD861_19470, partial [Pyrinomonadaceae bacterium]|nr:hypothetical protein [Pyrinomonadaceae bacterium]